MSEEIKENKKDKKEYGKFDRWEIEEGVQILIRAEQIKLDEEKMKYILPLLEKQKKALDNAQSAAEILYGKNEKKEENTEEKKEENNGEN